MKKILSLLVLLFAFAANALATVVWEGNVVLQNYTRSEEVVLPAAAFTDAHVGDKLVVSFTEYTADPQSWHQVEIWAYDAASGQMTEPLLSQGYHISPGATQCTLTIDDKLLSGLQKGVAAMAGTGYILTKVELVANDGVLWEGTSVFSGWVSSVQVLLPSSTFVTAAVGDELILSVKILDPNAWAATRIEAGDWSGAIGDVDHVIGATDETVTITLSDKILGALQSVGCVVVGDNFVLTKIALRKAGGSGEEPTPGLLWSGKLSFNGWNPSENVQIPGSAFADVKAGTKLVLACQKINADAWGAIRPEGGQWSGVFEGLDGYLEPKDGEPTELTVELTDKLLAQIVEKGMMFSGDNIVLTSVRLSDGNGGGNEGGKDEGLIWSGELTFNDWQPTDNVQLPAMFFADATTSDELVLTCQKVDADAWGAILPEASNWGGKFAGFESYYELADGNVTDIAIPLVEDLLSQIKEKGIMFSGTNITLTKVRLVKGGTTDGITTVGTTGKVIREYQLNQFIRIVDGKKIVRF